ncbi:MAG: GTP cyclohydrolase IIa [Nitrososphaerota archaeon]|jgi:GTP cyclohydrolase IIa|nr:GTP cyclohydrolase IIa [Nitrososphaerota archaeon]MDG7040692.1 GTP cyclohydrolase IIa [Nitrososphaerota archaeon]MDG7047119.1 GTP cyclohydrolase IIa [Nitrososphaerota archaeon]
MKVIITELMDYEGWVSSLGNDREWKVQATQHRLYSELQEAVAGEGGFLVPATFHHMLIIANGIEEDGHKRVFDIMNAVSPVPYRASSGSGSTLVSAIRKAFEGIGALAPRETHFGVPDFSNVVAAHFDVNSYLKKLEAGTLVEGLSEVDKLAGSVNMLSKEFGGISVYLGGDNVVMFAGEDSLGKLQNIKLDGSKVGIGVASNARSCLKLAAEALYFLRRNKGQVMKVIYDKP